MTHEIELFYLEQTEPSGALVTRSSEGRTLVHIRFAIPDGPTIDTSVTLIHNGSIRDWQSFDYRSQGETVTAVRTTQTISVNDRTIEGDGNAIPSYGLSLLVVELCQQGQDQFEFTLLNEPDGKVQPARLAVTGQEKIESPVGLYPDATRVELSVQGNRTNTYWVSDGRVIASDWAGARSYALPTTATANLIAALDA